MGLIGDESDPNRAEMDYMAAEVLIARSGDMEGEVGVPVPRNFPRRSHMGLHPGSAGKMPFSAGQAGFCCCQKVVPSGAERSPPVSECFGGEKGRKRKVPEPRQHPDPCPAGSILHIPWGSRTHVAPRCARGSTPDAVAGCSARSFPLPRHPDRDTASRDGSDLVLPSGAVPRLSSPA